MALIKKYSAFQNLSNFKTFLVDENPNSEFFRISEFNEVFTGGKNGFLIEGSPHLKPTTDIRVEILDVEGNPVYFEPGDGIPEYYEGTSILCSVHIYDDTPIGIGKITILGELETYVNDIGETVPVPAEWVGTYNVKWEKEFKINRLLANEDIVRFYERPRITINELSKPIFAVSASLLLQTGSLRGEGLLPVGDTSLRNWTQGTQYKLILTDSTTWPPDVINTDINIPSLNYSPTIIEILNDKEAITNIPYTVSNTVTDFVNEGYTASYLDTENESSQKSALTGSFAEIKMSQLKTFVGDVARVKIFRSSRSETGGFQFIQETKLESTELLADFTTANETAVLYGILTQDNIDQYWESSSVAHPISTNNGVLYRSIKIDYDTGSSEPQIFRTQNEISLMNDVEYTLQFKTKLSGSVSDGKYIKAYLSSSQFTQDITEFSASKELTSERLQVDENILASFSGSAKLVFEVAGDDWYISNISFRNAQDTSFSPDEFTIIQDVPRKLPVETYDYRFEFYDINNNYIPVDVLATKEFVQGNINSTVVFPVFEITSPAPYFRFATGSIGNPAQQQVNINVARNVFTGSVTYASSAYDSDGNYIPPGSYTGTYPGGLSNQSDFGGTLSIANFSGSDTAYEIGSIIYTASLSGEDEDRYLRVYRVNEGLAQSELFASANRNQFLYRLDNLDPNPSGQVITILVKRKQLDGVLAPITANSGSGTPSLTPTTDLNGTKTYIISASDFPYSTGEVKYEFTGSDQFGLEYSDSITIVPSLTSDSIVAEISKTSVAFAADSDGNVTGTEFNKGDGTVTVRVGNNTIAFEAGISTNNRFDIQSAVGSDCTPNEATPTSANYGISAMSADSAKLTLTIRYKAGDGTVTTFTKDVDFTKVRGLPDGIISGSDQLTSSLDTVYVRDDVYQPDSSSFDSRINGIAASGSGADWDVNLQNIPVGLVSGSSQLTGSYDTRYALSGSVGGSSLTGSGGVEIINNTASLGGSINNETRTIEIIGGFGQGLIISGSRTGFNRYSYHTLTPDETSFSTITNENSLGVSVSAIQLFLQSLGDSGSYAFNIIPGSKRTRLYASSGGLQTNIELEPDSMRISTPNAGSSNSGYVLTAIASGNGEVEFRDISGSLPTGLVSGSDQVSSSFVQTSGPQTVAGLKTFSSAIKTTQGIMLDDPGFDFGNGSGGAIVYRNNIYLLTKDGIGNGLKLDISALPSSPSRTITVPNKNFTLAGTDDLAGYEPIGSGIISGSAQVYPSISTQTGTTYSIVSGDAGNLILFTNNGTVTVTVNTTSLTNIGQSVELDYQGTGTLTVAAGTATLRVNENRTLSSDGQYSRIAIQKISSTEYRVFGELAAA
jgi:hypothetical protein